MQTERRSTCCRSTGCRNPRLCALPGRWSQHLIQWPPRLNSVAKSWCRNPARLPPCATRCCPSSFPASCGCRHASQPSHFQDLDSVRSDGMTDSEFDRYMTERVDDQLSYFDSAALKNQKAYRRVKLTAIACNIFTTMAIALAFTVPEEYKVTMGILALVLSTIVLGTY